MKKNFMNSTTIKCRNSTGTNIFSQQKHIYVFILDTRCKSDEHICGLEVSNV